MEQSNNINNMYKINIYDMENIIKNYLTAKHPSGSNGFLIRLEDKLENSYSRRRSYIILFPLLKLNKNEIINQIIDKWTQYAIEHIINNYDLNHEFTIVSIDPICIEKKINDITIQYSGITINPEDIVKSISTDVIEQMNKRIIELYMDTKYPTIDIADSEQKEQFDNIFNHTEMNTIYETYPFADVYIPINLTKSNNDMNIMICINGTINTSAQVIDIIDDIRNCLDTDDTTEIFKYNSDEIVFKFGHNKEIKTFNFITDPDI